jgi:hypothetical protein
MARRYLSVGRSNRGRTHVRYGVVFNARDSRKAWLALAFLILTAVLFSAGNWLNDNHSRVFGIALIILIVGLLIRDRYRR